MPITGKNPKVAALDGRDEELVKLLNDAAADRFVKEMMEGTWPLESEAETFRRLRDQADQKRAGLS